MPNTFGHLFRITTWGESHGRGVGVVVDGCPPRLPLDEAVIQADLDRRRPGQSKIVTPRKEADACRIVSGVTGGLTLGTPIAILVENADQRPEAYSEMETLYRPSHADYTYQAKYGIRAWQGGGRSSPGRRSAAWRAAPWRTSSSGRRCPASRSWPTSRRSTTSWPTSTRPRSAMTRWSRTSSAGPRRPTRSAW